MRGERESRWWEGFMKQVDFDDTTAVAHLKHWLKLLLGFNVVAAFL